MGFAQGLSGLDAANQGLDNIGNNIANSQTYGFKQGNVDFADMFSGLIGGGVQVSGFNQDFSNGQLVSGDSPLDMGIQGNGFFQLVNDNGQFFYSRNGQFKRDANGYIVNDQGLFLTGYQATGNPPKINPGSGIGKLKINDDPMQGHVTDKGTIDGNLDSNSDNIDQTKHPFDPNDKDSYTYTTQMDAYDSLGNKHTINVYYVKTADNKWEVYTNDSTSPKLDGSGKPIYGETTLQFDSSGQLTTNPATITVDGAPYKGSSELKFDIDFKGTTQQGDDNSMDDAKNDGYPVGQMTNFQIDDKGQIIASYSNGQKQLIGQVVLGDFPNEGGLKNVGGNCWQETNDSGKVNIGTSGQGNFGTINGDKLETSNVDLGTEMVNMIIFQRDYQSNAQSIKTQDQLLQTLMNI